MSIGDICAIVTACCAVFVMIGGTIWASVQYFATKDQTKTLADAVKTLREEVSEVKDLSLTAISNQSYYRQVIESRDKTIDEMSGTLQNVDSLFRTLEERLKKKGEQNAVA